MVALLKAEHGEWLCVEFDSVKRARDVRSSVLGSLRRSRTVRHWSNYQGISARTRVIREQGEGGGDVVKLYVQKLVDGEDTVGMKRRPITK